jgi:hypothetical protein
MAFFADLTTALQRQEVPGSILDIGKMGKILKEKGLIRTVPEDDFSLPGTYQKKSRSVVRILLESSIDTELHLYWLTKKKQKYSTERYVKAPVTAGQKEYSLSVPALSEIHRLRIDPATNLADIRISKVSLHYDGQDILLLPEKGLDLLQPLAGIKRVHHDSKGLFFTTRNTDAQLELRLADLRKPKSIEQLAFQQKRRETLFRHVADSRGIHSFPSSQVITKRHLKKNWPVLSLVLDDADLYHPDTGLVPNKSSRGRQWERLASCSYFDEKGKLRFASMVGVRMHGGKRMQLYSSYRLYFRKEYGLSRFPEFQPRIGFSSKAEPVKRLVVHHTAWPEGGWHFNNTLAYDIARRIGCQVPETRLALLYINGVEQGIYFFAPHLGERLLQSYFGHDDFIFYKHRSTITSEAYALSVDLLWRPATAPEKLTMEKVGKRIDLDNLARHLFSFLFCGTTDWFQGVAVLDTSIPDSKVFWINWDMDQSFIQDVFSDKIAMTEWQQRGWGLVYSPLPSSSPTHDIRPKLFSRLLNEDPAYREYVLTLYRDLLNHRLTADFFQERIQYYRGMLESYGKKETKYMKMLGEFMKRRPEVVRKETEKLFDLGPGLLCQVTGPADIQYEIDGYDEFSGYQGYYFKGSRITVSLDAPYQKKFLYWLVNGKRVDGFSLDLEVLENLIIVPVFNDEG